MTLGKLNDSHSYKINIIKEFDLVVRIDKISEFQGSSARKSDFEETKIAPGSNQATPIRDSKLMQLNISDMTGP